MLLCFSLLHANTIIAVMTFDFSANKYKITVLITLLMVTFVVSNICHSDNLNHQYLLNKLSATIKNKPVLLFVILANKYGITTYIILEY